MQYKDQNQSSNDNLMPNWVNRFSELSFVMFIHAHIFTCKYYTFIPHGNQFQLSLHFV